jgi:hypothetical protein
MTNASLPSEAPRSQSAARLVGSKSRRRSRVGGGSREAVGVAPEDFAPLPISRAPARADSAPGRCGLKGDVARRFLTSPDAPNPRRSRYLPHLRSVQVPVGELP